MAEGAEVFLFLLFEDQHLVAELTLGEEPVDQHEVLPDVEQIGVGLSSKMGTWGRISLVMTALKKTLLLLSRRTVSQLSPQYVYMFL